VGPAVPTCVETARIEDSGKLLEPPNETLAINACPVEVVVAVQTAPEEHQFYLLGVGTDYA
jgi:hypothetical protein